MIEESRLENVHNLLIDCILDRQGFADTHYTVEELEEARDYIKELLDRVDEYYCHGCCDGLSASSLGEILE